MRLSVPGSGFHEVDTKSRAGARVTSQRSWRDLVRIWGPVVLMWLLAIAGVVFVAHVLDFENYGWSVYDVYHKSAEAVIAGESLYSGLQGWVYLYPPLLAQSMVPLVQTVDLVTGQFVFLAVNVAVLIGSAALLQPYMPGSWKPSTVWIAMILFVPTLQAIYIGQITVIMMGLLIGAWVAVHKGQRRLAGGLLALAAWIKVYPALLVVYFLLKRDWRVIQGVAVAGIALGMMQIAISGPAEVIAFFETLFDLTAGGQPFATYENLSVFAFVSRLFEENAQVQPLLVDDSLFRATRIGLTLGILALTALAIYRGKAETRKGTVDWRFDLEYGLVALTILMLGSTLWISGLPPLLLVYLLIHRNRSEFKRPGVVQWVNLASYSMVGLSLVVVVVGSRVMLPALVLSLGFFGLMLVWGLMVWLLVFEARNIYSQT